MAVNFANTWLRKKSFYIIFKQNLDMSFRNYVLIFNFLMFVSFLGYSQEKKESEPENKNVEETVIDITPVKESEAKSNKKKSNSEVPFVVVEYAPCPLECEKDKTKKERKRCAVEFIKDHVLKKINTNLITELGEFSESERISFLIKFDEQGKLFDIRCAAPNPDLEKEGIRVLRLLPKFIPGKQRRYNVIVPYRFSIRISEIVSLMNDKN